MQSKKIMNLNVFSRSLWCIVVTLCVSLDSCSSEDTVVPQLLIDSRQQSKVLSWDEQETSVKFTATAAWSVVVEDVTSRAGGGTGPAWVRIARYEGEAGEVSLPVWLEKNEHEVYREAILTLMCGEAKTVVNIRQEANPNAVLTLNPDDISDYDKYYAPAPSNEGFGKGKADMLRSDARWSWWRMKQSEHFFVFWEPGFGANPNADSIPEALRVDIDDLLAKAEHFYRTNVDVLKFAETGKGKSYLDKYKMQIYLLYQTEWLATGAGYDNTIGALWVNPSTCQPVGSTIAHEIGHSFQYQVSCDKFLNGETSYAHAGFRYGYGAEGEGGNSFWEQCAQWQAMQDYPSELFGYHVDVWKANCHRHFNHEWMRYASYWLQYYWVQKHGIDVVGKIWTQSKYPEDPLMTYRRLYCNDDLSVLYAELYDYASRMTNYDLEGVRKYATETARKYPVQLWQVADGYYQVGYASCPGTTGFNVIALNVPEAGSTVYADFVGLKPGSPLAADDPGVMVDADGKAVGKVQTYNDNRGNVAANWRYGFVAVVKGISYYAPMKQGETQRVSYTVPEGTERLYWVVMGAPETYHSHPWNDNEADDEQWPYKVRFEGTDLLGGFPMDETASPKDVTLTYNVKCDASSEDYTQGSIDLRLSQELAQAFVMQPVKLESRLLKVGEEPSEGNVVIALQQPDGTYSYTSTANNGFWCKADGRIGNWGNEAPVFVEFNGLTLNYGHRYGVSQTKHTYIVRPTLFYTREGVQYHATILLTIQF